MIELKCPSCGADLTAKDADREYLFCEYCGHKILLNNEIKFTYRKIDDAEIRKQERKELETIESHKTQRLTFILGVVLVLIMMYVSFFK